jgi:predicted choloylglycine hydrolase
MARRLGASWTLAYLLSLVLLGCSAGDTTTSSASKAPPAPAQVPFPFPVIEMAGTGAEMGTQHGTQLGPTIRDLHARYLEAYFSSEGQRFLAMTAAAAFEPRVTPEHLAEIRALAKASRVDPRQMLLAHCFLDLSPMTACSTVSLPASASPDGVARFGRNLDFPSFDVADKLTVVQVYRPEGRNAFMAVGWPGMAGVLSGMNEHGLALANMEVTRPMRLPTAMPCILLYRTVLERCRTTQEAIDLIGRTPRQSANNLMVMDAAGNRAVIEITPEAVHVRRAPANRALISTNHQRGDDCDTTGRCDRFDCLLGECAQRAGRLDVTAIESMLADASQGKMTLQSMIFEPANRVVYLSAGKDAARKRFYRLDLRGLFERKVQQATAQAPRDDNGPHKTDQPNPGLRRRSGPGVGPGLWFSGRTGSHRRA